MWIRDPGWEKIGSGMENFGSGIRGGKKSNPGSGINIPHPQHWWEVGAGGANSSDSKKVLVFFLFILLWFKDSVVKLTSLYTLIVYTYLLYIYNNV